MLKVYIGGVEFLLEDKYHIELMTVLTNATPVVSWARGPDSEFVKSSAVMTVAVEPNPVKVISQKAYDDYKATSNG